MAATSPIQGFPRTAALLLASVLVLAAVVLPRARVHAAEAEAIDVVTHPRTATTSLSAVELEAIFTRSLTRWGDGQMIIPFNLADTDSVRRRFDQAVLSLTPNQVGRFWIDQRVRGLGAPPKQVPSVALLLKVIERLPGSIGYVPTRQRGANVKVVARIVDGRVVSP